MSLQDFDKYKEKAEKAKMVIQMWIGIGIVFFLLLKLSVDPLGTYNLLPFLIQLRDFHFLEIVAYGLALSSGIELAYMLFTPGPDEAIDPLITGLAATLLLFISKAKAISIELGASILLIVLAMYVLVNLRDKVNGT